jgi:hypothetical protein
MVMHAGLQWDYHFKCVFIEVYQSKTSKMKLISFIVGRDRHSCWFLAYADYMIGATSNAIYSPDEPAWLIPELQTTAYPGTFGPSRTFVC